MIRQILLAATLMLLISPMLLQAQIYRCVQADETVVFSDLPCGQNAERYESVKGISIVETPPGLEAIKQSNREFVERRQQRRQQMQADARARELELRERQLRQRRQIETLPVFFPVAVNRPNPVDRPSREPEEPGRAPAEPARNSILSNRLSQAQRDTLSTGNRRP